jgi:thioredoxin 1
MPKIGFLNENQWDFRKDLNMEIDINDANFEAEVIKNEGLVLVDFWASWCGPCKMMVPVIEELAKEFEGKIKIRKINVDENPKTASEYEILSIPALKFFSKGQVIDEIVGLRDKAFLVEKINSLMNK